MQLYAFDGNSLILASFAEKQKNYRCPECANLLRVRKGTRRQVHFYHLQAPLHCRLGKKTLTHLEIQLYIQSLLPKGESFLEHRFKEIGRIADLYWEPQKIVFEVQCSPISAEEAIARSQDYRSLGIEPVWILYDKRYNKRFCPPAEIVLRAGACYFTDGKENIYDQIDTLLGNKRIQKGPRLFIDLPLPKRNPVLHFPGDRFSIDKSFYSSFGPSKNSWKTNVKRFYMSLFYLLLENVK